MNKYFLVFVTLVLTLFCFQSAIACTITEVPLRKEFRASKNVFVGQVVGISDAPEHLRESKGKLIGGIVKFKIQKSWKGTKKSEISLPSNIVENSCGSGAPIDYFREGEKYLIFAEKDYVYFYSSSKLALSSEKIRKIDNVRFRVWAKINPF